MHPAREEKRVSKDSLEDENDFEFHREPGHLVRRLHQIAVGLFLEMSCESDLTPIQYAALNAICAHPGYEQREIARLIAIDRTTINSVTRRLAERELVKREPVGRRIDLYPTDKGFELLDRSTEETAEHSNLLLSPLSEIERAQFLKLMQRLVEKNNSASRAPMQKPERKKQTGD
ncbi:MarR family transcriptional regulator [Erythrobacter westpacificensis]|uniref:MarR family transcriptional regulator n=1 Tax=Erythrobacter westpacificensis TaxID=1055231 RepID=A0ABP9K4X7_9SPHN